MSNIVDFPKVDHSDEDKVFDQASLWIAKLDRGLTKEECIQIKNWLSVSSHRQVLFEMAEVWDKMDDLTRLADLFEVPARKEERRAEKSNGSQRYFVLVGAIAASFLVLAVALYLGHGAQTGRDIFYATYVTAKGEKSIYHLNDGSKMVLNTNGRVSLRFSPEQRLLVLEQGELNIEVAHDPSRPLNVMAGGKIFQAIGTAFNVQLSANREVELIVTDGKVRVEDVPQEAADKPIGRLPETAMTIAKGEKILLGSATEKVIQMKDSDIAVDLGWQQGNLIFRGETLEEALAEVTRYTDVEFEILDNDIRETHIAGLFKVGDIDGLLSTLDQNFKISSRRVSTKKIILKAD